MLRFPPSVNSPTRAAAPFVLLVDDHGPTVTMLRAIVERAGHRCRTARSGRDALKVCEERQPQVVVTDLSMPNWDGLGLARWLRMRSPSLPILLMTGEVLDERALEALRQTFTAIFLKPVNLPKFLDQLDRLMPVRASQPSA